MLDCEHKCHWIDASSISYSYCYKQSPVTLLHIDTLQTHPCNENRVFPLYFFPVWKNYTGKNLFWPCIAVHNDINPSIVTDLRSYNVIIMWPNQMCGQRTKITCCIQQIIGTKMYIGGQKSVRRLSVVLRHSITTWARRGNWGSTECPQ